jgi:hypothetical protein
MKMLELDDDLKEVFVRLHLMNEANEAGAYAEMLENGGWVLAAIEKHFDVMKIKCAKKVQILILCLSDGAIGVAVKYVRAALNWATENHCTEIDWEVFNGKIFPMGYPDYTKR